MKCCLPLIFIAAVSFAAAAQECPPAITARLVAAGVAADDVPRFCPAATALAGRAVVIEAHDELLDDLVRVVLPFGTQVALNDARYCGSTDAHTAELIAAATFDGTLPSGASLAAADCGQALAAIASRVKPAGTGSWAVVARMKLQWSPWRLTLTATEAMHAGIDPAAWPPLRDSLLGETNTQVVETSAASFPTPAGALPALSSKAAFYFARSSFAVAIVPASVVASLPPEAPLPPLRAITGARELVADANAAFIFGHDALNRFAAEFLAQTPIPLQTDSVPPDGPHRDVLGLADLTALRVEGTNDSYTIHGTLQQSDGGYLAMIVLRPDATGDLAVNIATFAPTRADCADVFDLGRCFAALAPKQAKALAASVAASLILGQKPWISFLEKRELELPWGGNAVGFRGLVRRITTDDEALVIFGDFRLRKR